MKSETSTFDTFAKVNDRHFKVVRQRPRIAPTPTEESFEPEPQDSGDIYSGEGVSQLEENDEITSNEAGFMRGFLSA